MSTALEDAEKTCDEVLSLLDGISTRTLPLKVKEDMRKRVGSVRSLLSTSKKKMMMRTKMGKQLAQQGDINLKELERVVDELSKESRAKLVEELFNKALEQLTKVEADVDKIVMYWKNYEAVLT